MIVERIKESNVLYHLFVEFLQEEQREFNSERQQQWCNKIIAFGEAHCLKTEIGGNVAAYLCFYANDWKNSTAFITALKTSPHYRRKGYAEILLEHCLTIMRSRGMKICRLEVRKENRAAQCLYEKCGFSKSDDLSSRENYLVMEMRL